MCMDHIHTYTQTWTKTDIFPEKGHTAKKRMGLCTAPTVSKEMQTRRSWEHIREQPASGRIEKDRTHALLGGIAERFLRVPVRHIPTGVSRPSGTADRVSSRNLHAWLTVASVPTV